MHQPDLVLATLREQTLGWLSADDRRNAAHLARTADVSETSVRRLINGDALPSPQNSLKVLMTVTGLKNVRKLQARFPGPLATYLADKFPMLSGNEGEVAGPNVALEAELRDPEKAVVFHRISHRDQVTRAEILRTIPTPRTSDIVDELIEKGLITESDGVLETKHKIFSMLDFDSVIRCSQRMEQLWFSSHNTQVAGANTIRLTTESVTPAAYQKIQQILRTASLEIFQVIDANPGNLPVFFKAVIDTMNQDRLNQGDEK